MLKQYILKSASLDLVTSLSVGNGQLNITEKLFSETSIKKSSLSLLFLYSWCLFRVKVHIPSKVIEVVGPSLVVQWLKLHCTM